MTQRKSLLLSTITFYLRKNYMENLNQRWIDNLTATSATKPIANTRILLRLLKRLIKALPHVVVIIRTGGQRPLLSPKNNRAWNKKKNAISTNLITVECFFLGGNNLPKKKKKFFAYFKREAISSSLLSNDNDFVAKKMFDPKMCHFMFFCL